MMGIFIWLKMFLLESLWKRENNFFYRKPCSACNLSICKIRSPKSDPDPRFWVCSLKYSFWSGGNRFTTGKKSFRVTNKWFRRSKKWFGTTGESDEHEWGVANSKPWWNMNKGFYRARWASANESTFRSGAETEIGNMVKNKPIFSVVMPTYIAERFVGGGRLSRFWRRRCRNGNCYWWMISRRI